MYYANKKKFNCRLDIYFFFVFCVYIELSCSVDQEIRTIERESPANNISIEKCDSDRTLCSCKDVREKIADTGSCCISLNCNDYVKYMDLGLYMPGFLPARMLPGFNIKLIALKDPEINVDENIFEKISSIEEFKVYESNIQIIPDFRFVRDSIEVITINGSRLNSLAGKHLQNLKLVKKLFFCNNYLQSIDPDVFKGTDNVEYLDLSYNSLTSIPPKLLDPMKKLYYFSAAHNDLLDVDQLFTVSYPKIIRLDFNNLTNGNALTRFDGTVTQRKVAYSVEHPGKFNFEFELVDLSCNLIKIRPKSLCFPSVINGLKVCRIRHLRFSGNELQGVGLRGYTRVLKLDVSRNKIQYLFARDFNGIENTVSLELQDNQIQWIESGTFSPFNSSLSYLDLSSNNITSINGSIRYLFKLEFLNLAYNSIQFFDNDEFIYVHQLTQLYLQHNRIKSVGLLQQFNQLQLLNIRHNDIKYVRPDNVPQSLRTMNLAGNPFKCDCYLQPFIDQVKKNNLLTTDTGVCLLSDLGNGLQVEPDCPDCSCRCIEYDNVSFMFADCSSRNLSVFPQFFRHNLTKIKDNETTSSNEWHSLTVHQNIDSSLNIEDQIMGISLENNSFKSDALSRLPPNLTLLYLAGNQMRYLPDSIFDHQPILKQLSLSGNPWHCDCNALKFKKWLASRTKIIRDIESIRCGTSDNNGKNLTGKILWKLSDLDLCPTTDWVVNLSVSFLSVLIFVTFCLVLKLVYAKYELSLKVFLYSHGFTFVKEEDIDYDKEYDAFISFSHEDDKFVIEEIINVIEDTVPSIRLCFSYRNFIPGEYIYDNITHAVQSSKKTILVLSKKFLQSEWCLVEFKVANTQSLRDKIHRIILIKYGELPNEMDPAIDSYLKSTTYLTWGEINFWKKLLFILPADNSVRNPVPKRAAHDSISLNEMDI